MKRWWQYARSARAVIATTVMSVALLLVAVPRASAHDFDDRGRCEERIERAEARLNQAIWKHGEYSRQAQRQRHELAEARERCWRENHAWWDGREHRWRTDRDRDRDDFDRDPR